MVLHRSIETARLIRGCDLVLWISDYILHSLPLLDMVADFPIPGRKTRSSTSRAQMELVLCKIAGAESQNGNSVLYLEQRNVGRYKGVIMAKLQKPSVGRRGFLKNAAAGAAALVTATPIAEAQRGNNEATATQIAPS